MSKEDIDRRVAAKDRREAIVVFVVAILDVLIILISLYRAIYFDSTFAAVVAGVLITLSLIVVGVFVFLDRFRLYNK